MAILLTGAAGFIGMTTTLALLARGETVIGVDNLNDYYSVPLKQARLARLTAHKNFTFHQLNLADREPMLALAKQHPDITGIVHLAAQAGVRYSLTNPYAYVESNLMGQVVMLELARILPNLKNMAYASSSSVYGGNTKLPFSIDDPVERPVSLYAATKRADELFGHTYAHLFKIPLTGLRFFTVYGPWGRPDMAAWLFTDAIIKGEPIKVFNAGQMKRDFTFVADIVRGVIAALDHETPPDENGVRHRVYNLGNHKPEDLSYFIDVLENAIGKKAIRVNEGMQPGDVPSTYADIEASTRDLGFVPTTPIDVGLPQFVQWFKDYHKV